MCLRLMVICVDVSMNCTALKTVRDIYNASTHNAPIRPRLTPDKPPRYAPNAGAPTSPGIKTTFMKRYMKHSRLAPPKYHFSESPALLDYVIKRLSNREPSPL